MKEFDVTSAIVDDDEVVLALFDNRYNSVMIIKPIINDETKQPELSIQEPDGADRLYWLEKFGMITGEEFQAEAEKVTGETEKLKLFERLKKELSK